MSPCTYYASLKGFDKNKKNNVFYVFSFFIFNDKYSSLFLNGPFPANIYCINICLCSDSNSGPLVSEATALPTEPQPLPSWKVSIAGNNYD